MNTSCQKVVQLTSIGCIVNFHKANYVARIEAWVYIPGLDIKLSLLTTWET